MSGTMNPWLAVADRSVAGSINDVLVPLIDVLLVVLCFLLWAGVSQVKSPIQAIGPKTSAVGDQPSLRIVMEPQGFWRWDGTSISEEELRGRLQRQNLQGETSTVLLSPSDELSVLEVSHRFNSLQVLAGDRLQLQLPGEDLQR